jgi:hypothetical protein
MEPVAGWHEISKTYGVKTKHYMYLKPVCIELPELTKP